MRPAVPALSLVLVALAVRTAAPAAPAAPEAAPALPPSFPHLSDHFPDEGIGGQVFLVVDGDTGEILRSEGGVDDAVPWDGLERLVIAWTGLERGTLDLDARAPCDSACWAAGGHGRPDFREGVAEDCGSWFARARERVPEAAWRARARELGLVAEHADGTSPRAWTDAWRRLASDRLGLAGNVTTTLLGSAGLAVTFPRGSAHALHDPRRRTRAFVFSSASGSWVIGSRAVLAREWVFALHLEGGSPSLAAARADRLLDDTRNVARRSTAERGGAPVRETD